ncbi:unnamed protein product [Caenorhabditis angaria]|uniref:Uncharacterized protein n=1 Tax=Caenorhabditis angaria TaxID=860376 RepID=A0A9P1N0M9_9PELO|nr:unnamed protein product [Caenorhabditis angaria]
MNFFNICTLIFVIFLQIATINAQFFFPFGNGIQQIDMSNGQNSRAYRYSTQNGAVKDTEGFFALCRGWSCQ